MEYSLIVAAVLVMSLGALQSLQDKSETEVANEFDCVSERPPPPSCQKRAVTTTTSTTISATTSTTAPVETTTTGASTTTTATTLPPSSTTSSSSTTTTAAPFVTTANWSCGNNDCVRNRQGSGWEARSRVTVTNSQGQLLGGAVVTIEVINASTGAVVSSYTCTTNNTDGRCETGGTSRPWIDIPDNVASVRFRIASIQYNPPAAVPTQTSPRLDRP